MKELGFGNKRIYVMTGEERDRLVTLICDTFSDLGFAYCLSRRAVNEGFSDEDNKKTYLKSIDDAHDHVSKLFKEFV